MERSKFPSADFHEKPLAANLNGVEWNRGRTDRGLIVRVAFDPEATSCTAINPGDGNRNPYLRMPDPEFVPS